MGDGDGCTIVMRGRRVLYYHIYTLSSLPIIESWTVRERARACVVGGTMFVGAMRVKNKNISKSKETASQSPFGLSISSKSHLCLHTVVCVKRFCPCTYAVVSVAKRCPFLLSLVYFEVYLLPA